MSTFGRYLAFQAPAWGIAGLVAWALARWTGVPYWVLGLGLALYVMKDLFLFRFVRRAYEHAPHDALETLQGDRGVVTVALGPKGWVQVGSESWSAELVRGVAELPVGKPVRVVGLHGVTLVVEPETEAAD